MGIVVVSPHWYDTEAPTLNAWSDVTVKSNSVLSRQSW